MVDIDKLEKIADTNSLSAVLGCLADICLEKAEHIRSNWQDVNTAKVWESAARQIGKLALRIEV